MNLYLLFIIIISLLGIKIFIKASNNDYLSKDNTTCVKGIFILIVFYSHLCKYISYQHSKDFLMYDLRQFLGQLMVTMFLFYSGYGIYESIKKKKSNYINKIPIKRILITLLNFDIAVLTYAIINQLIGNSYSIREILLALTGWIGIGNDCWYIFAILLLYLSTYVSFIIFDKNNKNAIICNWILTAFIMSIIAIYKGSGYEYYYNTLLCYPFGLTYSYHKDKINRIIFNNKKYILLFVTTILIFLLFKKAESINTIYYSISSLLFTLCILLLSVKVNLNSPILKWFGNNLFWVFILHRIPMIILSNIGYTSHAYRFALIAFVSTIVLTFVYSKIIGKLNNLITKKLIKEG